jgi:cardiolipin synthase (CMP-forming)
MDEQPTTAATRSEFHADLLLVPNLISLGRIGGVCVAAALYFLHYWMAALVVGFVTGLTDYVDGYVARKLNQTSKLGALLDSLADILAALVVMTVAVWAGAWPPYLLILWGIRDMGVLALRASAAQQGFTIPTIMFGKVAMNFTGWSYIILPFDLVRPFHNPQMIEGIHWLGLIGIHVGVALQWVVGAIYLKQYAARYRRD